MWTALLPLMWPTTCDTAYFGGIEIIMCTRSGIRWPSSIRLSFCVAKRRRTSPRYGRSWPNKALRRPFGTNTTWYLHSHREWHRLSNSSIVARPSVCLAAHGSERHDGPPNMSNFCCLPGIAGGLPLFIHAEHQAVARDQVGRALVRGDLEHPVGVVLGGRLLADV